jgi:hypothetical protein
MIERRIVMAVVLGAAAAVAIAQEGIKEKDAGHVMFTPAQITWGDPPPALPKGAQVAVLSGDPTKNGPFTIRAKFPPGYKVMPHWHPTAENLTVVSGVFSMGMGDAFDPKALHAMPAGGFSMMPAEMRHFAYTKGGATIQVHGMGPFTLTYVNAADDPRNSAPKPH